MPSISVNIATGADDGFSDYYKSGAHPLGVRKYSYGLTFIGIASENFGTFVSHQFGALRFQSISIPQGSTITSATLTVKRKNKGSLGVVQNPLVFGNNVDNASAWGTANRVRNISKTVHSASLDIINATSVTDVTSIVQDIVNRAGWVSNNALALGIFTSAHPSNGQYNFFNLYAYEKGGTNIPSLSVTYTSGGTGSLFSRPSLDGLSIAGPKQFNRLEAL